MVHRKIFRRIKKAAKQIVKTGRKIADTRKKVTQKVVKTAKRAASGRKDVRTTAAKKVVKKVKDVARKPTIVRREDAPPKKKEKETTTIRVTRGGREVSREVAKRPEARPSAERPGFVERLKASLSPTAPTAGERVKFKPLPLGIPREAAAVAVAPIGGVTAAARGIGQTGRIAAAGMKQSGNIAKSATGKLSRVGYRGTTDSTIKTTNQFYKTNTKSLTATTRWIERLGKEIRKPRVVARTIAGGVVAAIGSYPFAGFIKQEALQTARGTYTGAMIAGNLEAAQLAMDERNEINDPDVTEQILNKIPFANIVKQVKDFFDTERTTQAIDQKILDDKVIQEETGETDNEKFARIRQEELDAEKAAIDYYNDQRKKMLQWEEDAKDRDAAEDAALREEQRAAISKAEKAAAKEERERRKKQLEEEAAFWRKEAEKQRALEAKDREAIAAFWIAYRKESEKLARDQTPSTLNFGLL